MIDFTEYQGPPGCGLDDRGDTSARFDSVRMAFTPDGIRLRCNPDNVVLRIFGLNHNGNRLLEVEAYPAGSTSRKWGSGSVAFRMLADDFEITHHDATVELRNGGARCLVLAIRKIFRPPAQQVVSKLPARRERDV